MLSNAENEYTQGYTHPVSRVSHEATGQFKETISYHRNERRPDSSRAEGVVAGKNWCRRSESNRHELLARGILSQDF